MHFAILARFRDAFLKGFTRSWKELVIHGLILGGTLLYWRNIGGIKAHFWESAAPWLWALCIVIVWHAFKAAYLLDKEIGSSPSHGVSTIVSEYGKPFDLPVAKVPFYRIRVWGMAVIA